MKKFLWIIAGLIFIASLVIIWFKFKPEKVPPPVKLPVKHQFAYRINIDSLNVRYDKIKINENLTQLLSRKYFLADIDKISKEPSCF